MAHATPDAIVALSTRLLTASYRDVAKAAKAYKQLREARISTEKALVLLDRRIQQYSEQLDHARNVAHWAYGKQSELDYIAFDEACEEVGRDPEAISEHIFSGLCPNLTKIVFDGRGGDCPLCGDSSGKNTH